MTYEFKFTTWNYFKFMKFDFYKVFLCIGLWSFAKFYRLSPKNYRLFSVYKVVIADCR